jgi:hypothetical protein
VGGSDGDVVTKDGWGNILRPEIVVPPWVMVTPVWRGFPGLVNLSA